ncbi:unnamed protein product [Periconia digitata]|uniref:Uncharacterized protein n=1 Tax=Periconia digitata TaxID=1303443 RepID=A0A9W4UTL3_9PLEO|nr:unnamed protein product [Periconia digitata]
MRPFNPSRLSRPTTVHRSSSRELARQRVACHRPSAPASLGANRRPCMHFLQRLFSRKLIVESGSSSCAENVGERKRKRQDSKITCCSIGAKGLASQLRASCLGSTTGVWSRVLVSVCAPACRVRGSHAAKKQFLREKEKKKEE